VAALVACAEPGSSDLPADAGSNTEDTPTDDSGEPDDSGDVSDSGGADSAEPTDCELALEVTVGGEPVDTSLSFPTAPALGSARTLTLALHNPCPIDLRFLGHPDDWVSGTGFGLGELPPVLLTPGADGTLELVFTPGDPGDATGTLELPYDLEAGPLELALTAQVTDPLPLVLVGDGHMALSTDYGETVSQTTLSDDAHSNELRRGVCWGLERFVAVGGSDERRLWTSPDGESWTALSDGSGWIADCAFDGTTLVAAGGFHNLSASTDGETWSTVVDSDDHFRTVAWGDGRWVAAGDAGVGVSADGQSWILKEEVGEGLDHIAFGGGVFVAVGTDGTVVTSEDTETWHSSTIDGASTLATVLHDGSDFLASDGSSLWRSSDGVLWELVNATGGITPRAVIGTTLLGTSSEALWRSEDGGFSWTEGAALTRGDFNDAVFGGEP